MRALEAEAVLGTARSALVSNTTLTVTGDTFIRQGIPNQNEGDEDFLSVQIGSVHRTLLFFDREALRTAVGSATLISARVDLFIASNGAGWGSGRPLAIHSLRQASAENTATWWCAADANLGNNFPDCAPGSSWNMAANNANAPYVLAPTATAQIVDGTQGVLSFDVTQDVLAILAGTNPGHGWLIKKLDETVSGSVLFASREQGPAPSITLTIDAPEVCTPVAADDTTCDNVDDDCDGVRDEDVPQLETTCGLGACASTGMLICAAGQFESSCVPSEPAPDDASCNLVDDDCDGAVDEDFQGSPTQCGVGACAASGATSCVLGAVVDACQPGAPAPNDASCDAVDDDCDGALDEDYVSAATSCGVGACEATGSTFCVEGEVLAECTPGAPAPADASCDGVDDDCDGAADEEYGQSCSGTAALSCVGGILQQSDCSDHDPCNGEESCDGAGSCSAGTPPELDDGNPCTVDACASATGVTHAAAAAGTPCGAYAECDASARCQSLLPPDPASVAPALPLGSVSLLERVRFLFEGEPRIQTGVAPGAIRARSVAVMRGRVLAQGGQELPQVSVSVEGHPEYGQTLTRLDGAYDLVVGGGGPLTLRFERAGRIVSQRTTRVPWQDYVTLDDVTLVEPDVQVTHATLPTSSALVHAGSLSTDARGSRRARLYLPAGTSAERVEADGSSAPLAALSLRASELGVGAARLTELPGELPETAASVYAIELSADEVDAASGAEVALSRPASLYVDDFAGLPVGTSLPFGARSRASATWVGAADGRVIRLLGASSGLADLDVDGEGAPASPSSLEALGIDAEERAALAQSFAPGATFFRLTLRRLGAFGVSLPFSVNEGSGGVDPEAPGQLAPLDDPTLAPAPAQAPVLAKTLPLAGTPYRLEYRSDRVLGSKRGQQLAIPATGTSVQSGLLEARVEVQIAGQKHVVSVAPSASAVVPFEWDGRDAFGRSLHGWQRAEIRVGLVSPQSYVEPDGAAQSFAHTAFGADALGPAPEPYVRWLRYERWLQAFDGRQTAVGAWSLDQHHSYDPKSRVVYRGDGTWFATRTSSTIIDRFAGVAQVGTVGVHSGDGGDALSARMDSPRSVTVGPDGSLYIGTRRGVRRIDAETNVITTLAGGRDQTSCNASLSEGLATEMCVFARTIDFGRDGALYIGDNPTASGTYDRLRRLDLATGMIQNVAGVPPVSGCSNMGDGGPARNAALCNLTAHATAADGTIYLLDRGSSSNPLAVRKISTDGSIDTIATASWPATDDSADIATGPDGSVYVAQTRSVLRIWPTGEVRLFAGDIAANGNTGEGGPALLARFGSGGPAGVTVGPDGRVVIGDVGNAQLRMVDQRGIIRRIAGSTTGSIAGNGGSPLLALLGPGVVRSAFGPDGTLYVTGRSNHTVRAIRPSIAGDFLDEALVPSLDGSEIYRFSANGRHLETSDASTGQVIRTFGYDPSGRLVTVTDAEGQATVIERDGDGNPTKIVAPLGEETLLDTDADGYLSMLVGPDGSETELDYEGGGLLTHMVDASGAEHTYEYDGDGALVLP